MTTTTTTPGLPAIPTTGPARPKKPAAFIEESQSRGWHYTLLAILLIIVGTLLGYPLVLILSAAFTKTDHQHTVVTLDWLKTALNDPTIRTKLGNSLLLGLIVTFFCNCISFPLALVANRCEFPGKKFFASLVLVPLVLPPFVGAIGMRQIFGSFGSLTVFLQDIHLMDPHTGYNWLLHGGFWLLAILISLSLYPITYLNLQASLANIDPAMLEAAENLGGTRFRNFFKITLPLAMPGVFAGSALTFIWAFTELGTPLLLNYPTVISRSIFDELQSTGGNASFGYAQVLIVLAVSVSVYLIGKQTLGRKAYAMTSKAAVAATTQRLGLVGSLAAVGLFSMVTFLALLPHISVIAYSFTALAFEKTWISLGGIPNQTGWYRTLLPTRLSLNGYKAVFTDPHIYQAILNSLKYAGVSTVIDIILGVAIAWILVRTRVWGRALLDAFAMLPLAVPGLVMAFGYLAVIAAPPSIPVIRSLLRHPTPVQAASNSFFVLMPLWDGSPTAMATMSPFLILVIAYSMRRMPYLVRSASGGLQQTSVMLEEAALNMGASPFRTLMKITLPLIIANLIAGALLTFAFAMLEVSDSIVLSPQEHSFPIAKTLYALGNDSADASSIRNACCLGGISMLLLIATITSAATLMGKRLGAVFRA
jgi:iron(III) transport system permease protein